MPKTVLCNTRPSASRFRGSINEIIRLKITHVNQDYKCQVWDSVSEIKTPTGEEVQTPLLGKTWSSNPTENHWIPNTSNNPSEPNTKIINRS